MKPLIPQYVSVCGNVFERCMRDEIEAYTAAYYIELMAR